MEYKRAAWGSQFEPANHCAVLAFEQSSGILENSSLTEISNSCLSNESQGTISIKDETSIQNQSPLENGEG